MTKFPISYQDASKKLPDGSDDQVSLNELNKLNATMEELNEHGAHKKLYPTTINSAELQVKRKAAIHEFEKLERDIRAKSRQLGNMAGLPSRETPQERDERWQHGVPRTQKEQKCSVAAAIWQVVQKKTLVWGARYQNIPAEPTTVQRKPNNQIFSLYRLIS